MEHHVNMANGAMTLEIDPELAESLRARAEAAGQSVEAYALHRLRDDTVEASGLREASAAYYDELDQICQETLRTGGVPWEQVQARLRNFGKPR
jgi:hypothetical protein